MPSLIFNSEYFLIFIMFSYLIQNLLRWVIFKFSIYYFIHFVNSFWVILFYFNFVVIRECSQYVANYSQNFWNSFYGLVHFSIYKFCLYTWKQCILCVCYFVGEGRGLILNDIAFVQIACISPNILLIYQFLRDIC